jgi:lipid A 3-O-deacylase
MKTFLAILLGCLCAAAQKPVNDPLHKGANEWGFQTGGGFSIVGGVRSRSYWLLAGRYSRILTGDLCRCPLRGNLQYGVEAIPVMVFNQTSHVYAGGFSPLQLRYNFTAPKRVKPYIEMTGTMLGSAEPVPEGTARFNFMTGGGIGLQVFNEKARAWQLGVRFQHISNAGIAQRNPGINALYLFTGVSWWK